MYVCMYVCMKVGSGAGNATVKKLAPEFAGGVPKSLSRLRSPSVPEPRVLSFGKWAFSQEGSALLPLISVSDFSGKRRLVPRSPRPLIEAAVLFRFRRAVVLVVLPSRD